MLEVHHLSVFHGAQRILDDVAFAARRGEFLALVGPRGAGKTTLLNALGGALMPTSGSITLDGRTIAADDPERVGIRDLALFYDTDEPLGRPSRMRALRAIDRLARAGKIVVAALCDLDVAAFADRVALLRAGRVCAFGTPSAMLASDRLHDVYGRA